MEAEWQNQYAAQPDLLVDFAVRIDMFVYISLYPEAIIIHYLSLFVPMPPDLIGS